MNNPFDNRDIQKLYFQEIFDFLNEAVVIIRKNYQVLFANQTFFDLFDLPNAPIDSCYLFELQNSSLQCREFKEFVKNTISDNIKINEHLISPTDLGNSLDLRISSKIINKPDNEWIMLLVIEKVLKNTEADHNTLQNKFEKQLSDERNFTSAVLSTEGAIVVVLDLSGIVVDLNPVFQKITGYTIDEMKGKPFWSIFPEKYHDQVIDHYETVKRNIEPVIIESWIKDKQGALHYIRWRNAAIRNNNGVITHLISTGIDITDRQEDEDRIKQLNEDLRQYSSKLEIINKELETFSYSVSHDLKAPLSIISGFSQLILDDYNAQLDPELVSYLVKIQVSTRNMFTLINDLMTLSQINRADLNIENIDLSEMVSLFLSDLQQSDPERKLSIVVQKNIVVKADKRLLHLAIENLLNNAWKYCSKNEITEIEFGSIQKDGSIIYFIKDNGVGFDMKYKEKIFQPFQRLHSEREFKGTGIGLATVERVLHRHNGRIWAESEIGEGSTFYFTLSTND
jgi:PAS domain S-box-containing protein